MNREFLIFLLLLILGGYIASCAFGKSKDDSLYYTNFSKKELLNDLAFAENEVFSRTYTSNNLPERLERLELAVFGAIQEGAEDFRIKRIRKSVTNVASGGNGLQYTLKGLNLGGNTSGSANWVIGNMHNFSPYNSNLYARPNNFSHRLPSSSCKYSHRLPPPPPQNYSYNSNSAGNVDFLKNYSIGTSVRILED